MMMISDMKSVPDLKKSRFSAPLLQITDITGAMLQLTMSMTILLLSM